VDALPVILEVRVRVKDRVRVRVRVIGLSVFYRRSPVQAKPY